MYKTIAMVFVAIGYLLLPSMASAQTNPCGMVLGSSAPIFCDTFDVPNPGISSRTGGLHPDVWGVSRLSGLTNIGANWLNTWPSTALVGCSGTTTVLPPNDIVVCNGQLREAVNDNAPGGFGAGTVTVLAMYPKQPFDFAGRTGTVSFDVSNDTQGSHAAWPEFWFSDTPIPAPFSFQGWNTLPQHGFGIRFHGAVGPGQQGACPNGNNLDKRRWTVGSAVVSRNYVLDDTEGYGTRTAMNVAFLDCVIAPPANSGVMNHIELRISQNQIDVYATDAGVVASPATLRLIARVTNANLTATRGLIWIEDAHYNADKADDHNPSASQAQHTFVWDNVAFDGPFTYRDFSYDALDANTPVNNFLPRLANSLGKLANLTSTWNVLNLPANPNPTAVRVLFNVLDNFNAPVTFNVTVNGHAHSVPWPYPDTGTSWRAIATMIPVTDLIAGTNVVVIGADKPIIVSNVNIVLVNVPGGVPVIPGSNNTYPTTVADSTPPSTPMNVQATSVSSSAINLTWTSSTDNVAVVGYKVFRGGVQVATVTSAAYSDIGLTASTLYSYNVLASDAAGNNSPQSLTASATTQSVTPPTKTCTITVPAFTIPQGQASSSFSGTATCQ